MKVAVGEVVLAATSTATFFDQVGDASDPMNALLTPVIA
jgi:hypothetical protein